MRSPLIMVAPNGARRTKADHPELPMTTPEIVETARASVAAGAQALHLHVRDADGHHSLDPGRYREALAELSAHLPDLPVQITTEAAGVFDVATQLKCLHDLKPKWASISVREIERDANLAASVYATCADQDTKVQHILYDVGDIELFHRWRETGIIDPSQDSVLLVLGRHSKNQNSDPAELAPLLTALGPVSRWMVCAFGQNEHKCLLATAQRGGDVRIGFENSVLNQSGAPYKSNADSLATFRALYNLQSPDR